MPSFDDLNTTLGHAALGVIAALVLGAVIMAIAYFLPR